MNMVRLLLTMTPLLISSWIASETFAQPQANPTPKNEPPRLTKDELAKHKEDLRKYAELHGGRDRFTNQRQISVIELVLQRFGAGRNNGLATAHQRRQQIRKSLASPGSRLDHELSIFSKCICDCFRHPRLTGPWLKTGQQ